MIYMQSDAVPIDYPQTRKKTTTLNHWFHIHLSGNSKIGFPTGCNKSMPCASPGTVREGWMCCKSFYMESCGLYTARHYGLAGADSGRKITTTFSL